MSAADWAETIGASLDDSGSPTPADIASHIRSAVRAAGSLRRGQITRGLNESYAPFEIEDGALRASLDRVLQELVLIGDLTELQTASGAAYILTPPRLVVIDNDRATVLGASNLEPGEAHTARQLVASDWPSPESMLRVDVRTELGIADWRLHLVENGGVDAPLGTAETLFSHVARLSTGGDRLETLTADQVRVLSGRQGYFGRYDGPQPDGRWQPAAGDGTFCAVRHAGHRWRPCVLSIADGRATVWEPEGWELWQWAIVGQTIAAGDPVCRYDEETLEFSALVPLPRQVRRLLTLGGEPTGSWRWRAPWAVGTAAEALLTGKSY